VLSARGVSRTVASDCEADDNRRTDPDQIWVRRSGVRTDELPPRTCVVEYVGCLLFRQEPSSNS